jgi:heme exporter protein D
VGAGVVLMQFSTLNEFIAMGGHGLYVWMAFGITFAVAILMLLIPMLKKRKIKRDIIQRKAFAAVNERS